MKNLFKNIIFPLPMVLGYLTAGIIVTVSGSFTWSWLGWYLGVFVTMVALVNGLVYVLEKKYPNKFSRRNLK